MSQAESCGRWLGWTTILATLLLAGGAVLLAAGDGKNDAPPAESAPAESPPALIAATTGSASTRSAATVPASAPTRLTTTPTRDLGPDVVILKELVDLYEPVPFDHRGHARMAEMLDGCVTCHHRSPDPATRSAIESAATNGHANHTQAESDEIPACKSCHPVDAAEANIRMPNLKGAYHRQCLNCHRDWAQANACSVCHRPLHGGQVSPTQPTVDDIMGRMHPPIKARDEIAYRARFTPAMGSNVLFRHREHIEQYGLKCVVCHRRDNCSDCHARGATTIAKKPLKPGRTWQDTHGPCATCHEKDRCAHCHYDDDSPPPPVFSHASTGQKLDEEHEALGCDSCHDDLRSPGARITCGDSSCHRDQKAMTYPDRLPGEKVSRPGPPVKSPPPLRPIKRRVTTVPATSTGGAR